MTLMTKQALREYVEAVLDQVIFEDFEDSTRPVNNKPGQPQQAAPAPQQQTQFSLEHLRQIKDLNQVHGYVGATLGDQKIGEGQGRTVFRLGNKQVLKVARDPGGQGQNQAEASVCNVPEAAGLFPKTAEVGPQNMWLVTQEAQPMTDGFFKQATGLDWNMFVSALKGAFPGKLASTKVNPRELETHKQNFINNAHNPFLTKILNVIKGCQYEPGDLAKMSSWGVVDGHPVIIDSGFTEAVNQAYYKQQPGTANMAATGR